MLKQKRRLSSFHYTIQCIGIAGGGDFLLHTTLCLPLACDDFLGLQEWSL
jgi:hypothetical protein